mgnify:FL=1
MERIELYKFDAAHISISIGLYFNKEGQLIFDGYDRGKRVEYALGDSDYEYQYIIEPLEVEKLYTAVGVDQGDRKALLLELKKRFGKNSAFSDFGKFMSENNIDFIPFTWR